MKLWKYEGNQVQIAHIDGDVFIGYADIYHDADDTANGIAALQCIPHGGGLIDSIYFEENEIASIEIISDDALPAMAKAI